MLLATNFMGKIKRAMVGHLQNYAFITVLLCASVKKKPSVFSIL